MIFKRLNFIFTTSMKVKLFFLYMLMVIAAGIEMLSLSLIPLFISQIISSEITNNFVSNLNLDNFINFIPFENTIIKFAFIIFLVFFVKFLYMIALASFELHLIKNIKIFFAKNIYSAYIDKKYNFFLKKNSSELGRNIITEINNAVQFIKCILSLSKEIFLIIVIGFLLIIFDPTVTLIGIMITSLFVILFYTFTDRRLKKIAIERIRLTGDIFKHVIESFSIIKEIKVYSKEKFFTDKFINSQSSLENYLLKRDFIVKLPKIVFEFLAVTLIVLLISVFSILGKETQELFILLSLLAVAVVRLLPSFNQISIALTHFGSYRESFLIVSDEIENFLTNKINQLDNYKIKNNNIHTQIQFKNVSFSYDANKDVGLKNISLDVRKGEMIGIIGRSGAGKSTLVNILLKLLEPQQGEITFESKELTCGYVPQDIFLLDSSIKENIALAQDENSIDKNKLLEIIKKCQLAEFVDTHKKGIDLVLGERGIRISGGEKQRIGLARALYASRNIIILDEATSSLDNQTEESIIQSILNLKNEITVILIAHRLTSLRYCDRVIYLEEGKIKDEGKLDDLLIKYPDLEKAKI